jgi:hypothetical protein
MRPAASGSVGPDVAVLEVAMDPWDLSIALFGGIAVMFFGASVMMALSG